LSNNIGHTNRFFLSCGTFRGYWNANQVCGVDLNVAGEYNCLIGVSGIPGLSTLYDLMSCDKGVESCYQQAPPAIASCCGCANWDTLGIYIPPSTNPCVSQNPLWVQYIQPNLLPFKMAAPTAYTFPYDDASSTFQCQNEGFDVDYTINFCPEYNKNAPPPAPTAKPPSNSGTGNTNTGSGPQVTPPPHVGGLTSTTGPATGVCATVNCGSNLCCPYDGTGKSLALCFNPAQYTCSSALCLAGQYACGTYSVDPLVSCYDPTINHCGPNGQILQGGTTQLFGTSSSSYFPGEPGVKMLNSAVKLSNTFWCAVLTTLIFMIL